MHFTCLRSIVTGLAITCVSTLAAAQDPAKLFDKWDRNKDGKLDKKELPALARPNFSRADTDKNGSVSRDEHNAFLKKLKDRQKRGGAALKGMKVERDIPYAKTDNPRQKLDLFLPEKAKSDGPLPVVAFIHGGGWRGGSKNSGGNRIAPLVKSGNYAGVSIGYRLSGEATWPAQIHDCKAAIRWIRANAKKYNFDPKRIGVIGTSAGGHLVAMLGTSGHVADLAGKLGECTDQSNHVSCVVNFFGPADLLQFKNASAKSPISLMLGGPIAENKDKARSASPVTHITKENPPFLHIHGDKDPLVPYEQSEILDAALDKAGVDSTLVKVEGAGHGWFRNTEVDKRVATFLDKHLRGKDVTVSAEPISRK